MKTKMLSWIEIECDLSEHPKEVSDYVLDQFVDRVEGVETEVNRDYDKQKVTFTSPTIDLIQRIIEEKEADMNFEKRTSQEVLERGLEEA